MAELTRALSLALLAVLAASCTIRERAAYEECTNATCARGQGSCERIGVDRDAGLPGARICTETCAGDEDCLHDPHTDLPGRCVMLVSERRCVPSCETGYDCSAPLACAEDEGACLPEALR